MSGDKEYARKLHVTLELEVETDYVHDHAVSYVIGEAIQHGLSNSNTPEHMLKLGQIKVRVVPRQGGTS